jgi:hypothetical protein
MIPIPVIGLSIMSFGLGLAILISICRGAGNPDSRLSIFRMANVTQRDYDVLNARLRKLWPAVFVLWAAGAIVIVVGLAA